MTMSNRSSLAIYPLPFSEIPENYSRPIEPAQAPYPAVDNCEVYFMYRVRTIFGVLSILIVDSNMRAGAYLDLGAGQEVVGTVRTAA
jgi:hypothetical protein